MMAVDPIDRGVRIAALRAEALPRVDCGENYISSISEDQPDQGRSLKAHQPPPGLTIGAEELGD